MKCWHIPSKGHKPLWYLALLIPRKETQPLVGILGFGDYKSYHWEYYSEPEMHGKPPALNGAQSRTTVCSPAACTTWPARPCGIRGTGGGKPPMAFTAQQEQDFGARPGPRQQRSQCVGKAAPGWLLGKDRDAKLNHGVPGDQATRTACREP